MQVRRSRATGRACRTTTNRRLELKETGGGIQVPRLACQQAAGSGKSIMHSTPSGWKESLLEPPGGHGRLCSMAARRSPCSADPSGERHRTRADESADVLSFVGAGGVGRSRCGRARRAARRSRRHCLPTRGWSWPSPALAASRMSTPETANFFTLPDVQRPKPEAHQLAERQVILGATQSESMRLSKVGTNSFGVRLCWRVSTFGWTSARRCSVTSSMVNMIA
jgi:hypothetical protein